MQKLPDRVRLWEAVVLSLGFDPGSFFADSAQKANAVASAGDDAVFLRDPGGETAAGRASLVALFGSPGIGALQGRLTIAVSRWGGEAGIEAVVQLEDFVAWALGLDPPWELPDRLSSLVSSA